MNMIMKSLKAAFRRRFAKCRLFFLFNPLVSEAVQAPTILKPYVKLMLLNKG